MTGEKSDTYTENGSPLVIDVQQVTTQTSTITNKLVVEDDDDILWGTDEDFVTEYDSSHDRWRVFDNGSNDDLINAGTSEIVINEDASDLDFRVEGTADTDLLRSDANNDRVGIGTSGPGSKLEISGGSVRISGSNSIVDGSGNSHLTINDSGNLDVDRTVQFQSVTGTPTFSGHDHTSGGMTAVPNSGLSNSSVTVAGNSVSLGSSTTVSIDDLSDVASSTESAGHVPIWHGTNSQYENSSLTGGTEISITNADASITVGLDTPVSAANLNLGNGVENNSGSLRVDEDFDFTFTSEIDLDGGALVSDHLTFDNNSTIEHNRQDVSSNISTDGSGYYSVDASSSRTITISSSDEVDGREINIKRNGANTVTVNTHDPSTTSIDDTTGSTQLELTSDNETATLVYNNNNDDWEIY